MEANSVASPATHKAAQTHMQLYKLHVQKERNLSTQTCDFGEWMQKHHISKKHIKSSGNYDSKEKPHFNFFSYFSSSHFY